INHRIWNARFSYNADPTFSRNKSKTEREGRLRVAGRLKHASFLVNTARCLALILGDSVGSERDDSSRLRAQFHKSPRRPLMRRESVECHPLFFIDIFWLALIMGESSRSECGLGFVRSAIIPTYPAIPERFMAKS